ARGEPFDVIARGEPFDVIARGEPFDVIARGEPFDVIARGEAPRQSPDVAMPSRDCRACCAGSQ
ncbi:MAG: hypothetical protein AAGA41_05570, partial [Pseudomonadota bacterium]